MGRYYYPPGYVNTQKEISIKPGPFCDPFDRNKILVPEKKWGVVQYDQEKQEKDGKDATTVLALADSEIEAERTARKKMFGQDNDEEMIEISLDLNKPIPLQRARRGGGHRG